VFGYHGPVIDVHFLGQIFKVPRVEGQHHVDQKQAVEQKIQHDPTDGRRDVEAQFPGNHNDGPNDDHADQNVPCQFKGGIGGDDSSQLLRSHFGVLLQGQQLFGRWGGSHRGCGFQVMDRRRRRRRMGGRGRRVFFQGGPKLFVELPSRDCWILEGGCTTGRGGDFRDGGATSGTEHRFMGVAVVDRHGYHGGCSVVLFYCGSGVAVIVLNMD
jgi:hypothetical protein